MTSLNGGFGATLFPVETVDNAYELDPGHESLLRLLETAINSECGAAWQSIAARLSPQHYTQRDGVYLPVAMALPMEVSPQEMTQVKATWPILAVYREGEPEFSYLTLNHLALTQRWSCDYIIGPLSASHKLTVGKFAVVVARCIANVIHHGYHPDFRNGVAQFFGEFSSVQVKSIQGPGVAQSLGEESGGGYYGLTVTIETMERTVYDGYAGSNMLDVQTGYVAEGESTEEELTEAWIDVDFENETPDNVDDEIGN